MFNAESRRNYDNELNESHRKEKSNVYNSHTPFKFKTQNTHNSFPEHPRSSYFTNSTFSHTQSSADVFEEFNRRFKNFHNFHPNFHNRGASTQTPRQPSQPSPTNIPRPTNISGRSRNNPIIIDPVDNEKESKYKKEKKSSTPAPIVIDLTESETSSVNEGSSDRNSKLDNNNVDTSCHNSRKRSTSTRDNPEIIE